MNAGLHLLIKSESRGARWGGWWEFTKQGSQAKSSRPKSRMSLGLRKTSIKFKGSFESGLRLKLLLPKDGKTSKWVNLNH